MTRYYAVASGKVPGVYLTWNECRDQVIGIKGSRFKAFDSLEEANSFISAGGIIIEKDLITPPKVKSKRPRSDEKDIEPIELPKDWYLLKCDGGCRNPSLGAGGAVCWNDKMKIVFEEGILLTTPLKQTNNVSEYTGVLIGLRTALKHNVKKIRVQLDSKLIVQQVKGHWQINAEHLIPLYKEVKELQLQFEEFEIEHIRREFNTEADKICNVTMDKYQIE
jgi:ribonuclease HI